MSLPVAILVGGLATRLRPLTEKIPKALLPVNGEPFLAHQLRLLKTQGIHEVVICAWYRSDLIQEFAGNGSRFGLHLDYSLDGETPLGTGGALRKAVPLLGETFFVLYGDSYLPCDYAAVEKAFFASGKKALMTVFHNRNQGDRSNVQCAGQQILAYDKKTPTPLMEHIDYGLGVFQAAALEAYPEGRAFDLADIYRDLLCARELAAHEVSERFYEVGSLSGIQELERHLKKQKSIVLFCLTRR